MSIFPTKVLLATDDSGDAELAATTAFSLAKSTDSELHVVHVWRPVPSVHFDTLIRQEMRREAQEILDEQVKKVEGLGAPWRRLTSGRGIRPRRLSPWPLR